MNKFTKLLIATLLLIFAMWITAVDATASESGDTSDKIAPKIQEILRETASYFKNLKSLQVDYKINFNEVGDEYSMTYKLTAVRPNKYYSEFIEGESGAHVISDGKDFTIYIPDDNVYVRNEAPEDFEGILERDQPSKILGNIMILSRLLGNNAYETITSEITEAEYVGLDGDSHHLKFKQPFFSLELWINNGDSPLIKKAVAEVDGREVQIEVTYSGWKVNEEIPDKTFSFTLPKDALSMEEYMAKMRSNRSSPADWLGKQAPAINLDLLSGGKFNLADYKDKSIVILDFWATWCGPCRMGLPIVSGIAEEYKSKGVVFYSINQMEPADMVSDFMDENDWNFKVALDSRGIVSQILKVSSIPTTMIIGRDGSVQVVHQGVSRNMDSELRSELDTLISGKKLAEPK